MVLCRKSGLLPRRSYYQWFFEGEDQLLIGTGDEGKIFRVDIDGDFISLGKCEASQILAMHRVAGTDKLLLATGNSAKIYELTTEYKAEGSIESKPYNTRAIISLGQIALGGSAERGKHQSLLQHAPATPRSPTTHGVSGRRN